MLRTANRGLKREKHLHKATLRHCMEEQKVKEERQSSTGAFFFGGVGDCWTMLVRRYLWFLVTVALV